MKTIKKKNITDVTVIAIVLAENWFNTHDLYHSHAIRLSDFVVCKWFDFHDGVKSHIEGKQTIAICREQEDAELIFNSKTL